MTNYKKTKNNNGITLLALVITIILLLILAIISISIITNSGIITKAEKAANNYDDKGMEDEIRKAYFSYLEQKELFPTSNSSFANKLSEFGITYDKFYGDENHGYTIELKLNGKIEKIYKVSEDGTIENITVNWEQNDDGTIIGKNEYKDKQLTIGDYVNYSDVLSDVIVTDESNIIKELNEYSGTNKTVYPNDNSSDSLQQEKNLKWRILDVKEGKIRLISEKPTDSKIRVYGYNGYNNIVYLLDEACDLLYSKNGVGKSQNLKIEDIEDKINKSVFNYLEYSNPNVDIAKYGETVQYKGLGKFRSYAEINKSEIGFKEINGIPVNGTLGLSEQNKLVKGYNLNNSTNDTSITATQTYWERESMTSADFRNGNYLNIFIKDDANYAPYWLSSRCIKCYTESNCSYCISKIQNGGVDPLVIFNSQTQKATNNLSFRPVVTLNPNINLGNKVNGVWQINQ